MQIQPAQRLCFNCNDKFTMGHKCNGAQLLILEGIGNEELQAGLDMGVNEPNSGKVS